MRRLVALLVVTGTIGGCGSAGQPSPAWHAPSSATAAPSAAQTTTAAAVWTKAQARTHYLEIVAPYNTTLEAFVDAAHAQTPWRQLRPLAADLAEACERHAKALRAGLWPAAVRTHVDALARETDLARRAWQRAAKANTAAELSAAVDEAVRHAGDKPATKIRTLLGLPEYGK